MDGKKRDYDWCTTFHIRGISSSGDSVASSMNKIGFHGQLHLSVVFVLFDLSRRRRSSTDGTWIARYLSTDVLTGHQEPGNLSFKEKLVRHMQYQKCSRNPGSSSAWWIDVCIITRLVHGLTASSRLIKYGWGHTRRGRNPISPSMYIVRSAGSRVTACFRRASCQFGGGVGSCTRIGTTPLHLRPGIRGISEKLSTPN